MDYDSILPLGKKISDELGYNEGVDTLGKWMSQYIAELIIESESTNETCRRSLKKECAEEILKIWSYRNTYPNKKRPFQEFEKIFEVLEGLDEQPRPIMRFLLNNTEDTQNKENEGSNEIEEWLASIDIIDKSARIMIKHCLYRVTSLLHTPKSVEWFEIAKKLVKQPEETLIIEKILSIHGDSETIRENNTLEIDAKIHRLEDSKQILNSIIEDLYKLKLLMTNTKK